MPRAVQSAVSDKGQSADELASVLLSTANHSASLNHVKAQKKGAADCRSLINALVTYLRRASYVREPDEYRVNCSSDDLPVWYAS